MKVSKTAQSHVLEELMSSMSSVWLTTKYACYYINGETCEKARCLHCLYKHSGYAHSTHTGHEDGLLLSVHDTQAVPYVQHSNNF